jgi:hypothetical protein
MDGFLAVNRVGPDGKVIGVDMSAVQLAKARGLAGDRGSRRRTFGRGTSRPRLSTKGRSIA